MSWKERVENTIFSITTGDGKVYVPLWKPGETSKDFNTAVYNFINLPGGLVDRRKVKERKFNLVFWFTGDDCIDTAEAFDQSANDNRAWLLRHPYYGDITGQPLSVSRNDISYNSTEFAVDFLETITSAAPQRSVSVPEQIITSVSALNVEFGTAYISKVTLKPIDVTKTRDNVSVLSTLITGVIDKRYYNNYELFKNKMFASVDQLIFAPVGAIHGINDVVLIPANLLIPVATRVSLSLGIYNNTVKMLTRGTSNDKAYFEAVAGASIAAMAVAMTNPLASDFTTRKALATASDTLSATYYDYLTRLDAAYIKTGTPGATTTSSFSASSTPQLLLKSIVTTTLASLASLVFDAKQERVIVLKQDTNLILLTHRYIGLDVDDLNMEAFRQLNGIKNKELFQVRKGRTIRYYV